MIIICGMFAAITAVLSQLVIPIPLVPITGQTLAVGLTATILGSKYGAISMICYMLLGAVGLPVFAEAKGGLGVIIGPTGGYIISFFIAAFVIGFILEKTSFNIAMAFIANIIGMIITLTIGTIQLKYVADLTWSAALAGGVYPFIIVGLIKAFLASWIGISVRKRLIQAKLLRGTTKQSAA
ncbi:biotin transporter BioY [Alteribacillus iranensis]|nr:biotin transporter BioY [Alteribacillus iranensis]